MTFEWKNLYESVLIIFSLVSIIISAHSLLQFFNLIPSEGYFRMASIFKSPSILTNYLASIIPFLLTSLHLTTTKKPIKIITYMAIFTACLVILLSNERTGILAVVFGSLFVISFGNHNCLLKKLKRPKNILLIIGLLIMIVYLFYVMRPNSVMGRIFIYINTLTIVKSHLFFGVGYNKFQSVYNIYQSQWFKAHPADLFYSNLAGNIRAPFNEYLAVLTELGIIGFVLFLVIFITIASEFLTLLKSGAKPYQRMRIGAAGALISISLCALWSYPFSDYSLLIVLLFFLSILNTTKKNTVKIPVRRKYIVPLVTITLLVFVYFSYSIQLLYKEQNKWMRTALLAKHGYFDLAGYNKLYTTLKSNSNFLFNYGAELLNNGKYASSASILEASMRRQVNTSLFVFLGDAYLGLKDNKKAEQYYLIAINMVPCKFIPKYAIMEFYRKNDRCEDAKIWAHKILNMKEKVYSKKTAMIKNSARILLNSNCDKGK